MSKKKILIIVDNPLRDLPACALLAAELAKQHKVYLTPMSQASTDIFRIQPHLVLLNYLRPTNVPLVSMLQKAGIAWSILDTEGGIFMKLENSDETTYTMTLVRDHEVRNQVAQVFVWGEELYNSLLEKRIYPAESLVCLGTPRMDFYHSSFSPYFKTNLQARKDTNRPMILVNTSFAGNNPKFSNREKEVSMLVSRFGYTKEFITGLLDQFDQVMKEYIRLTAFLAERFPEVDFILRPHPFESWEIYRRELGHLPNVQIDCRDTVARWIWESKALIHYECSTALESAFAGRPSFSLAEFKDIRPVDAIQKVTDYSKSFEELQSKIQQVLQGTYQMSPELQNNLRIVEAAIYRKVDGQSARRIALSVGQWLETHPVKLSVVATAAFLVKQGVRSLLKKMIKGQLVPAEKRITETDLKVLCSQLSDVLKVKIEFRPVFLSSSYEIVAPENPA